MSRLLAGETVDGAPTSVQVAGTTLTVPNVLLRHRLTDLINDKARIRRLAEQSGIQTAWLNSDVPAIEYWRQILREADRRHKVDEILAKVGEEIGKRKGDLEEAYRLYADASGDVAATLAEEKAQRKESVNLYGQAMTQLSGKQIKDLVDALIHAYPSEADLAMMVRIELNETLAAVAAGSNLSVLIFDLITWAERSGRVNELVAGAVRRTPGNPMLQEYVRCWPAVAAPTPMHVPSSAPSGSAAIDIFLCYSRQNLAAMRTVEAALRKAGLSVWIDEGLEPSTPSWTDAIEEAVAQAMAMVVLLSPAAKESKWVKKEVTLAQRKGKQIYPLLVDGDEDSAVLFQLIDVQWVDGRQRLQEAVGRVLAQMGQETRSGAPSAVSVGDEELDALARRATEAEQVLAQKKAEAAVQAAAEDAAKLRAQRDLLGALEQIGLEWVTVPAGEFTMGSNDSGDEQPIHQVYLSEYQIARHPVTNAQYELFVKANSYAAPKHWKNKKIPPGKENHPVVNVSWKDAQAFCAWAGVRLPTEAEWEKAARGTDGRKYPWGNEPPTMELCNFNSNVGGTTPIGSYPKGASPYGVLDMAGNVWEWVNDRYGGKYYSVSPSVNPQGPASGTRRVLRGGSWSSIVNYVRSADRNLDDPDFWFNSIGFRCVRSL
ncbi:MAG: SUMF1/EgtB/PvdO family nonheme iron enzyme [Chloroflexi bacterium]|nr:SUMF1/EgtB/PvdO family nonheme iron enzyme [Chloroflexota bacterium]